MSGAAWTSEFKAEHDRPGDVVRIYWLTDGVEGFSVGVGIPAAVDIFRAKADTFARRVALAMNTARIANDTRTPQQ